jgi:hypothetical protein
LQKGLEEVFGTGNPLVLTLPYRKVIDPDQSTFGDFTVFFAGATAELRKAFVTQPDYRLRTDVSPNPDSPNGFQQGQLTRVSLADEPDYLHFGLATVLPVKGDVLRTPTDDWPFLYLRKPMIPTLSLRGMLIMAGTGVLLIFVFMRRIKSTQTMNGDESVGLNLRLFFLGAGFMLVETKAVVTMALLFGSTWVVNSVVFFALLLMILFANYWAIKLKTNRLWPYYLGLVIALIFNTIVPIDFFLGMDRRIQILGSCILVFAPILFAGIIFANSFKRTTNPDRAFGINIAGAMVGGLAEYSSMLLGFQYVALVALVFYMLSALKYGNGSSRSLRPAPE